MSEFGFYGNVCDIRRLLCWAVHVGDTQTAERVARVEGGEVGGLEHLVSVLAYGSGAEAAHLQKLYEFILGAGVGIGCRERGVSCWHGQ